MEGGSTAKKVLGVVSRILAWILVVLAVGMMVFTIVSVNTFDKNDADIFGLKFYIVKTDSMSKSDKNAHLDVHFNAGDLIIVKTPKDLNDAKTYVAGDVISFMSQDKESFGETITHMIREVKKDADGKIEGYVTYGTNTGTDDETLVTPEYVLGKYTGKLPGVGLFFQFLKSVPGYIICILIPFMLLIIYQGVNCIRLFRRYKKEQMAEMQAERDKIEEERMQAAEMMKELMALKAQMAQQEGAEATAGESAAAQSADTNTNANE